MHIQRRFLPWLLSSGLTLAVFATTQSPSAAPVTALCFTPDGAELVSAGSGNLEVRSTKDGAVQRTIPCELLKVNSLCFHPGKPILAIAGGSPGIKGEVLLLDWRTQRIFCLITNHADVATSVAFSKDGSMLGVASADRVARLWRVGEAGSAIVEGFTLKGHSGPVLALAFSPGGGVVITASADRSLKVWSTEDGRLIRTLSHHTEAVNALAFRPRLAETGERPAVCASAGDDRTVRIWQPEIGRMVRIVRYHEGPIFALACSRDGRRFFSAGKEGVVRQIDAESDTVQNQWRAHRDWIYALAVSPNGAQLASGDWSGMVRLWAINPEGLNLE